MLAALRLSRAGYGDPERILAMRADLVIAALDYEMFLQNYEAAFVELNKGDRDA